MSAKNFDAPRACARQGVLIVPVGWCASCGEQLILVATSERREARCACPDPPKIPVAFFDANARLA